MKANTFEIKRFTAEIKCKDRKNIKTGCCLEDTDTESIGKFSTYEEAIEELKKDKYKPSCRYTEGWTFNFYAVEEYAVECYEADEDGDFIEGSDFDMVYDFEFDTEEENIRVTMDKRFA